MIRDNFLLGSTMKILILFIFILIGKFSFGATNTCTPTQQSQLNRGDCSKVHLLTNSRGVANNKSSFQISRAVSASLMVAPTLPHHQPIRSVNLETFQTSCDESFREYLRKRRLVSLKSNQLNRSYTAIARANGYEHPSTIEAQQKLQEYRDLNGDDSVLIPAGCTVNLVGIADGGIPLSCTCRGPSLPETGSNDDPQGVE